jgi:sulfoacetaldehyde acetyltransferase
LQETHLPEPLSFAPTANPAAPAVDSRTVAAAVDRLLDARAPVILVGTGVDWSDASDEVRELAELLSAPVATSYTAKGVFPENHPLALGCLGNGGRPYARQFFQDADLLLAIGTSFSEGTTLGFGYKTVPERAKIIQIDTDPEQLGRNYPTEIAIQADAKTALRAIIDRVNALPAKKTADRAEQIQRAKQAWQSELDEAMSQQGLTYATVLRALNGQLNGNEILTTSGMTGDTLRNIDSTTPIIHAGEFRAIGTALATAYGVKIGRPDARVICVTGDGSFMMEQQELATARYHNIPVMVLILRNNAYGGMKRDQQKNYGGRIIGTELFIPDLAKLAALYGAKSYSVTKKEELTPVFKEALAKDEFVVVDVRLD